MRTVALLLAKDDQARAEEHKGPFRGWSMKKNTTCRRCGACCHVDMAAYAGQEDIRRWKSEGRHDIVARLSNDDVVWAGDRMVRRSGQTVTTCFYLNWNGSSFSCEIYDTRPLVCRNYVPGSSELCPRYYEP